MVLDVLLLASRLLLATVFTLAGASKLADIAGSRRSLIVSGLPPILAAGFVLILPVAEIVVAGLLLATTSALYGAAGSLALLLVFIAGIAANLALGRQPDCHCFGRLHSEPMSRRVLTRNLLLAGVAVFLLVGGWNGSGPSLVAWLIPLTTFQRAVILMSALGLVLLTVQLVLIVRLVSQRASGQPGPQEEKPILVPAPPAVETAPAGRPVPLAVGSRAPAFSAVSLEGPTVTLDALRAGGKPVVLVFSDPRCGTCRELLPKIARWQQEHAASLTLAVISRGTPEHNRAGIEGLGLSHVLLQQRREISTAYAARPTPIAVLVNADGTVGSPPIFGNPAIAQLVARARVGRSVFDPAEPPAGGVPTSPVSAPPS